MKKCPFCAEEIQDEAIKCKHCGEFLNRKTKTDAVPWYFKTSFIVLAFCAVGPLALPLIWWRPQTSLTWKIGLTVATFFVSWLLYLAMLQSIAVIKEYYQFLNSL